MKKLNFVFVICIFILSGGCTDSVPVYKDPAAPVEKRVKDLLSRMTLEEKAAQLDMLDGASILESSTGISAEKMDQWMKNAPLGSVHDLFPVSARLSNEIQDYVRKQSRLGIPPIMIEEALHGYQGGGWWNHISDSACQRLHLGYVAIGENRTGNRP